MSDGAVEHGIVASVRRAGASFGDLRPFLEIQTVSAAEGWTAGGILRHRETFAVWCVTFTERERERDLNWLY